MIHKKTYSYFGLTLLSVSGGLDMPARLGNIHYDWGDTHEALLHEDDIFWKKRDITINALSNNAQQSIRKLEELPKLFTLSTSEGDFNVSLLSVTETKQYSGGKSLFKLTFREDVHEFITILPAGSGGKGILIDTHHLKNDLGITVSKVSTEDNLLNLKQSPKTVFLADKGLLDKRPFRKIKLECHHQNTNLKQHIGILKRLLAQSGERILSYYNRSFKVFLSEGFSVVSKGSTHKIILNFNVIYEQANFVAKGFIANGFIGTIDPKFVASNVNFMTKGFTEKGFIKTL